MREHERLIILDIGGYFAKSQAVLAEHFGARFLGVVEMTENGHQRYEQEHLAAPSSRWPAAPQAGGGHPDRPGSVVYSAESLARTLRRTPSHVCQAALFLAMARWGAASPGTALPQPASGAGETGRPLRQVEALSHGFKLVNKAEALGRAELVICCTGNGALDIADLRAWPRAMVASVTSADDEFAFCLSLTALAERGEVCPHVLALSRPDGSTIFLLNREAVNFVHGAVIGEYVYLVLAEIIEGAPAGRQASASGLHELPQATMQRIARHWLTDFHGVTP